MTILGTLLFIAFCCRNIRYKYVPPNGESPLFKTRVCMPLQLDAAIWVQCYRYYYVLGKQAYSYEHVHSVEIRPKKFSYRPQVRIDRYEKEINTHRYLYFYAEHAQRILHEIEAGKQRVGMVTTTYLEE